MGHGQDSVSYVAAGIESRPIRGGLHKAVFNSTTIAAESDREQQKQGDEEGKNAERFGNSETEDQVRAL